MTTKKTDAFSEGGDDVIEPDSGIWLIDADPEVIARRLDDKPWADRALFFNIILVDSLRNLGKTVEILEAKGGKREAREYMEIAMIGMHERLCRVLDIWGPGVPPDENAAHVFALSISPEHRVAARHFFCGDNCGALHRLFEPGSGLMVYKNMSEVAPPGLSELWRRDILGMKREGGAAP